MIRAMGKVFHLGDKYVGGLVGRGVGVEITEKLDGAFMAFGWEDGEMKFRSKRVELFEGNAGNFTEIVDYVLSVKDRIPPGFIYYGEYLRKPKQNSIAYDRVPNHNFALFGVWDCVDREFCTGWRRSGILNQPPGFEAVPVLYEGVLANMDIPEKLIKTQMSFLGDSIPIEGVVIKAYGTPYMIADRVIPMMMGKLVRPEFVELNKKRWAGKGVNKLEEFVLSFREEARWEKAVQHLRDDSALEYSVRDIGKLCQEVVRDILEEEADNAKEWLWNHHKKQIQRSAVKGLPEWYKNVLEKRILDGIRDGEYGEVVIDDIPQEGEK